MKARRCGPLRATGRTVVAGQHLVTFRRESKWVAWRVIRVVVSDSRYWHKCTAAPEVEALLVRKIEPSKVKQMSTSLLDLKGLEKFPRLREFLSDPKLELADGVEDREPGSVYFQARGGVLAVTLKEPSQSLMLRFEVPSIAMLFPAMEAALDDATSLWEVDPWARKRKPRGKK